MMQLGRRFTDGKLQVQYDDDDVFSMTSLATTCLLLLIMNFLSRRGLPEPRAEVEKLLTTYGFVDQHDLDALSADEAAPDRTGARDLCRRNYEKVENSGSSRAVNAECCNPNQVVIAVSKLNADFDQLRRKKLAEMEDAARMQEREDLGRHCGGG
jgi:hypothetical protein